MIARSNADAELPFVVVIDVAGALRFVWDDRLQPLCDLGCPSIKRASHVEPSPAGGWSADMAPSGGPVLGPFVLRREALAAEREWLTLNRGL